MDTRTQIKNHLLRFGEMPPAQKVAWLGQALVLLLQVELDRLEHQKRYGVDKTR